MQEMLHRDKEKDRPRYIADDQVNQGEREIFSIKGASEFGRTLWETEGAGDRNAAWLEQIRSAIHSRVPEPAEEDWDLDKTYAAKALKKKKTRSALGPDRLASFWRNRAHSLHKCVATAFRSISRSDEEYPQWFSEGKISLVPKPGEFSSDNQRPITCLNTIYKWYTSCLLVPIEKHLNHYELIEGAQGSARARCSETVDNLRIDRMVTLDYHRRKQLKQIDREASKIVVENGGKHTCGSTSWLYLSRNKGGRGLRSTETEYKETKVKAAVNLYQKRDPAMKMVRDFEERAESVGLQSLTKEATAYAKEHGLQLQLGYSDPVCVIEEGEVIPGKKLLPTRLYTIHKTRVSESSDSACRMCGTALEGMAHILPACPALAQTKYLARHDAVLKVLFFEIIFDLGLIDTVPPSRWYSHFKPQSVYETAEVQAYWDVPVHREYQELRTNRVDARIVNNRDKQLSSVVPVRNQSTKQFAITTTGNYLEASAILRFTKDLLLVNVLILCGDIAQNPGPGAACHCVSLKVCHWNIQHLTDSKLEEIRVRLTNSNNGEDKPDILILTETFGSAKVPDSFYFIPGFQLHRKDRIGRSGGGILAFVNSSLQVKRREDLEETDLECLWLETCPFKSKRPLLIAGVYRPPSYKAADDKRLGKNIENSGFRESHSTETALIRLVDQLLFNLDNDKATGLVFIDYKKAFDLIDHNLLLSKLKALGVGESSLPLFRDYLSGRRQYVNIDGHHSTQRALTLGVPQGSILGPILFLVFINDLPATLQHSVADIYADDTTISYSTHYTTAPNDISVGLQTDIDEILNWSADNRMILNETKTKSMLVTGKRLAKKMEQSTLQLNVNSTELEQVNSHKLLGVTIDSQLTFDQHVENLCTKLSQRIAVLRKIRRFLPIDQRKLYYNAMIKQTMLYASTIWTSCSAENLQKVFKLQKRAARVILGADTKANSVQLFRKLDWVPFFHEAKVNRSLMVYKRLSGDCPPYMSQMLVRNADINERSSRHGQLNLVCPRFKRESEGGLEMSFPWVSNRNTMTSEKTMKYAPLRWESKQGYPQGTRSTSAISS
ncbi:putative RNA-directed DNA polymerase from transposon BS [Stylophora pistillata]|uniref:Putative RNA-directed DNA polymerase from transposon BS n=1 Tax=Stylophora pistillata TaxID=50429 RepID=A0A2B4S1D5_STYPI|nr:putative RNA-directed DNA polymerase from transposon BS [Stylophora pistillata]